jgi:putative endonuclease
LPSTLSKGQQAEDLACEFLTSQGLKLVTRNFHSRFGEIDIVMLDANTLVFVEVRARREHGQVSSLESINSTKQRKLIKTAQYYLQNKSVPHNQPTRFDVVAITLNQSYPDIEWLKNAIDC